MAKSFLMGAEVEYSMSCPAAQTRGRRKGLYVQLLEAVKAEHQWLPDLRSSKGVYIDNGSRYYLDSGNHNELSSPELQTPREIAVYDRAGEVILRRAKQRVKQIKQIDICITKNNVNFSMPDRAAWGQHEAYTCWVPLEQAAAQLIPHLVSRIPYAGAGCLSSHPHGEGYELSQRARHMTRPVGLETTHNRAIFCTRAWKPSDTSSAGWTRTNLISKDSQRCSFGMYLTYGVTSLLMMIVNEGHQLGRDVRLKDPVRAMRMFSVDPALKKQVQLENGKWATALDIQRAYFNEARPHVERGEFPEWTLEVLEHWAETIDVLATDPRLLSDRLDTYLKHAIFERQLARAGMSWQALRKALQTIDQLRGTVPETIVQAIIQGNDEQFKGEAKSLRDKAMQQHKLQPVDIEHLQVAVRLQALELNYHELGGLFDQMLDAGLVDSVVVTPEEVEQAVHHGPPSGRASARGKAIKRLHGQPWAVDWQYFLNREDGKWIDLRDPFARHGRLRTKTSSFPEEACLPELEDVALRIAE